MNRVKTFKALNLCMLVLMVAAAICLNGCGESLEEKKEKVAKAVKELKANPENFNELYEKLFKDYADVAVEPVGKLLSDKDARVRYAAAVMLGNFAKSGGIVYLREARKDEDAKVRAAVAEALGKIKGGEATRTLIEMVRDENTDVQIAAIKAMGGLDDEEAVPVLIPFLGDERKAVRDAAVESLKGLGAKALRAVVQTAELGSGIAKEEAKRALKLICERFRAALDPQSSEGKDRLVRRDMCRYLGQLKYKLATADLIERLSDSDPDVRAAAAEALGKIGARAAIEPLKTQMNDKAEEMKVRLSAAVALGKMGDKEAIDFLVNMLTEQDESLRVRAASALSEVGLPAVRALLSAVRSKEDLKRWGAAKALGEMRCKDATKELIKATKDKSEDVRIASVISLGRIGDPQAVPALLEALEDESSKVRWHAYGALQRFGAEAGSAAIEALQQIKGVEAKEHIIKLLGIWKVSSAADELLNQLRHKSERVRSAAAWAIGEIGATAGANALLNLLRSDESIDVRREAAHALGKLRYKPARGLLLEAFVIARDVSLKAACANALAMIDGRAYSDADLLKEAMKSIPNESVRNSAAAQLRRIEQVPAM
ncbi:MAG: HEAT repeat domain-containing protein [Armatimonadota bacterium]|nr:HEAT repeat domain-containing protein [Armatimonadota bacterium]MCX7777692.1 HEAT repeat domain-containing protein [Armatimonadota bacterium]MDW8025451.1 HEAT repeat domain-containing protein [Armatimonadota bacterium]